jgi:hypothetical protein
MNTDFIKALAKELATRINNLVNIPLVKEEDEQVFFEMVVMLVLEIVISKLGTELKTKSGKE